MGPKYPYQQPDPASYALAAPKPELQLNGGDAETSPPAPPPLPDYTGYVRPEDRPIPLSDPDDGILTPEKARAAREAAQQGRRFRLVHTGGWAVVRRFTPTDRIAIGRLPEAQQQRVLNALAKASDNANARRSDGTISRSIALDNMRRQEDLINAYCVAGFVRPPLIFAETDRTNPDQVVVTDLDMKDREAFFAVCETDSEAAARRFAPFPGEPAGDVATGGSFGELRPATE